ncbi:S-layer family protein [Nostoc flagelliforme FACHB-838]|uniref:S-layer family protein n=1 Tax=Nostoc flagelliforme FACHB-838 TaxID=2692904 RepID=A0ABR8E6Y5_9NOSO|nr:S-layer family protein [Nostoc flagelliforme]MBD2536280.1 S-layer family protein [Nostoc flagelliforme FACHB-838]
MNGYIVFGPNARLEIGGSFLASTASSLKFKDNLEFSATDPQSAPLLNINVPIGLQFGVNPGSVKVLGNGEGTRSLRDPIIDTTFGLRVLSNQTLALMGGDISLEGATLKTAGGRIELGSVARENFVSLARVSKGFTFGYDSVENFENIQLSKQVAVDASGVGGGDIQVWGERITLSDDSQILANTLRAESGGVMLINAKQLLALSGSSQVSSIVNPNALGKGGDLTINTRELLIKDGAFVNADTFGAGKAGNLTVNADSIEVASTSVDGHSSSLSSQVNFRATGSAGDLTINTFRCRQRRKFNR